MAFFIPCLEEFPLGRSFDTKTCILGPKTSSESSKIQEEQVNKLDIQFALLVDIQGICSLLQVPPGYVIKVAEGQVNNTVINHLLKSIEGGEAIVLAFKASFIQSVQHIPSDDRPKSCEGSNSNWVKSVQFGNELLIVIRLVPGQEDNGSGIDECLDIILEALGLTESSSGHVDDSALKSLVKEAEAIDRKLKTSKKTVHYCSQTHITTRPESFKGILTTLESFSNLVTAWSTLNWSELRGEPKISNTVCQLAIEPAPTGEKKLEEKPKQSLVTRLKNKFKNTKETTTTTDTQGSSVDDTVEDDSFVVVGEIQGVTKSDLYLLRIAIERLEETPISEDAQEVETNETYERFSNVLKLIEDLHASDTILKEIAREERYASDIRFQEVQDHKERLKIFFTFIQSYVQSLDCWVTPTEQEIEELASKNIIENLNSVYKEIRTKLAPGNDVQILLMGKTGHGKSSTANSILGKIMFQESAAEVSTTQKVAVATATIDGRNIRVVDMPGVCHTDISDTLESYQFNMQNFGRAMVEVSAGFDALIIVIAYGTKITDEEQSSIELLKRNLGDSVIKSHCLLVITRGDDYQRDKNGSFDKWCRSRKGYLKTLIEECGYRCLLFNNRSDDDKCRKTQVIHLVNLIDKLGADGVGRYTSELLEFSQKAEQKRLEEQGIAGINKKHMEEVLQLKDCVDTERGEICLVSTKEDTDKIKERLKKLKKRVDELSELYSEGEPNQLTLMIDALQSMCKSSLDEIENMKKKFERETVERETNKLMEALTSLKSKLKEESDKIKITSTAEELAVTEQLLTKFNQSIDELVEQCRDYSGSNQLTFMIETVRSLHRHAVDEVENMKTVVAKEIQVNKAKKVLQDFKNTLNDELAKIKTASTKENILARKGDVEKLKESLDRLTTQYTQLSSDPLNIMIEELHSKYQNILDELGFMARTIEMSIVRDQIRKLRDETSSEGEKIRETCTSTDLSAIKDAVKQLKKRQQEMRQQYMSDSKSEQLVVEVDQLLPVFQTIEVKIEQMEKFVERQKEVKEKINMLQGLEKEIERESGKIVKVTTENELQSIEKTLEGLQKKLKDAEIQCNSYTDSNNLVNMVSKVKSLHNRVANDMQTKQKEILMEEAREEWKKIKTCDKKGLEDIKTKLDDIKKRYEESFKGQTVKEVTELFVMIESAVSDKNNENKFMEQKQDYESKKETAKGDAGKDVGDEYGCFPGDGIVTLASGQKIFIREVQVGDKVLTINSSGQLVYDTVYMFGHREPDVLKNFIVIETKHRSTKLSKSHLVFCVRNGESIWVAAEEVCLGDSLITADHIGQRIFNHQMDEASQTLEKVTRIREELSEGLYAPFTMSGTIVVDGILASCYIDVVRHEVSHALLWPVRQLYKISPPILAAVNGSKPVPGWASAVLNLL